MDGWIKLSRDIVNWELFKDGNALKAWLYLLANTNFADSVTKDGRPVKAGQVVYSTRGIADSCGMSVQEAKTALKKLIATHSLTQSATHRYTVGTVENWAKYQSDSKTATQSATHYPTTSKKYKEYKDEPEKIDFGKGGIRFHV